MLHKFLTAGTALCDRLPVSNASKRVLLAAATLAPAAVAAGVSRFVFDSPGAQLGAHFVTSYSLLAHFYFSFVKQNPFDVPRKDRGIACRNSAFFASSSFWLLSGLLAGITHHSASYYSSVPLNQFTHTTAFVMNAFIASSGAFALSYTHKALKLWGDATQPFSNPTPPQNPVTISKNNTPTL